MDTNALNIILAALTTGAATGLKDTTSQAVKDGYAKLKALLQNKLASNPTVLVTLGAHESKPDVWYAQLEDGLRTAGVDQDEEIIAAARRVLTSVQTKQVGTGSILVQNQGVVQGQVMQNQGSITMTFGETPKA